MHLATETGALADLIHLGACIGQADTKTSLGGKELQLVIHAIYQIRVTGAEQQGYG
jgi:hypothetical protein